MSATKAKTDLPSKSRKTATAADPHYDSVSNTPPEHLSKLPVELTLSELEWTVLRVSESFARWEQSVMSAVSDIGLGYQDHMVLHMVGIQKQPRSFVQIAQTMNRLDLHNIKYSLGKLEKKGMVERSREKGDRAFAYSATDAGAKVVQAYAEVRRHLLIPQVEFIGNYAETMASAARLLSLMTAIYEEQTRAAGTLEWDATRSE